MILSAKDFDYDDFLEYEYLLQTHVNAQIEKKGGGLDYSFRIIKINDFKLVLEYDIWTGISLDPEKKDATATTEETAFSDTIARELITLKTKADSIKILKNQKRASFKNTLLGLLFTFLVWCAAYFFHPPTKLAVLVPAVIFEFVYADILGIAPYRYVKIASMLSLAVVVYMLLNRYFKFIKSQKGTLTVRRTLMVFLFLFFSFHALVDYAYHITAWIGTPDAYGHDMNKTATSFRYSAFIYVVIGILSDSISFRTRKKSPDSHPFFGQKVLVQKDRIITTQTNGYTEEIRIAAIDYITIAPHGTTNRINNCWVHLKSFSQHGVGVCTVAENYHKLESALLKLPNFDHTTYNNSKSSFTEGPETILWQKVHSPNFEIAPTPLPVSGLELLQKGLLIEDKGLLVMWKDFDYLETLPITKSIKEFPNPMFKAYSYSFKKPTILGGIKVDELSYTTDAFEGKKVRLDLPVEEANTSFKLSSSDPKGELLKIKKHLNGYFAKPATILEPTSGHLDFEWQQDAIKVHLYCFFRQELKQFDTIAWLKIRFAPDTTRFYETAYFQQFELTKQIKYAILDFGIDLLCDYRKHTNVSYTPMPLQKLLDHDEQTVIWHDSKENIIGIGNTSYAFLFKRENLTSLVLEIQNYRASEGRNALVMYLKDKTSCTLGSVSNTAQCIAHFKSMEKLLGIPVKVARYDEHY